jgi:nitrous oxide reductase accessory protein NosL
MRVKNFLLVVMLVLVACSSEPESGPAEVKWDRVTCERCRMVLSDPRFAAQIRYFPANKRSKVAMFDDIGCAVLWLEQQPWANDSRTEIWVADHRSRQWIDARKAYYVKLNSSPMEYGFGAQQDPVENALDFAKAITRIKETEKKFNLHGQQLEQRLREQAQQRELRQ